jgi:hypothetical protein
MTKRSKTKKSPDPKKHQIISIAKSIIRIGGSFAPFLIVSKWGISMVPLCLLCFFGLFILAEILGILEELI